MTEYNEKNSTTNIISHWQTRDALSLYAVLEKPNWAPWLAASPESLAGRANVFPKGQLVVKSLDEKFYASLSMNRINWNGKIKSLSSWDDVAGEPTTFENTYIPSGNTLVMMSMNVNPEYKVEGYAKKLIEHAKVIAVELDVDYLIGSFRPNQYGAFKLKSRDKSVDFTGYCKMKREDGLPTDAWLRNLVRNGMQPIAVDHHAMTVRIPLAEFTEYRKEYNPKEWKEIEAGVWECGEVGSWTVDEEDEAATYKESNLWGVVWKKAGLE